MGLAGARVDGIGLPARSCAPHCGPRFESQPCKARWPRAPKSFVCAASLHVAVAFAVVAAFRTERYPCWPPPKGSPVTVEAMIRDIVFIPSDRFHRRWR